MILQQLGIFGWKEADENLVLASLLIGDPLLLIGNHGCAKTHVANKVAQVIIGTITYFEYIIRSLTFDVFCGRVIA